MTHQNQPLVERIVLCVLILLFLPIAIPLLLLAFAGHLAFRAVLYLLVWLLWIPKGKDVLLVYSDSPIWHEYMTQEIMPLVRDRAVVLNWSERRKWSRRSLGVSVFHHFGGGQEFNPMVVKFRLFRRAKILRYWAAFKDWKRGYTEPVERLRDQLTSML